MSTLKDLIQKLAVAAGMDPVGNEDLKNILETESLSTIEVSNPIVNKMMSNLMNEDAARNNPKLLNHFRATLLNGIDAKIIDTLKDLDFPEDAILEISASEKTVSKIDLLKSKIRDFYEKKGVSSQTKEEFEKERKTLNDKITDLSNQIPQAKEDAKSIYSNLLKDRDLNQIISSYDYGLPIPKEAMVATVKTLLQNEIEANKWKLDYSLENSANPFRLLSDGNLEVYKDNQPVSLKNLVDRIVADNKLIKVSDPAQAAGQGGNLKKTIEGNQTDFSSMESIYDSQIAELTTKNN